MIVLSVGMPRAGSGWHYNLIHDLMKTTGCADARDIRERYHLLNILTEVNCNIGVLSARRLGMMMIPALLGKTFVIKAHAGPTPLALWLIRAGQLIPMYIYRDPRDAMLSAHENGQRALEKGQPNAFSHLVDFNASLDFILEYVRISQAWMKVQDILHTRYESLVSDYSTEAVRMVAFLGLDREAETIQAVVEKFRPESARSDQKGLHFSTGKSGRFRQKYTAEQHAVLAERLGDYLVEMGYAI